MTGEIANTGPRGWGGRLFLYFTFALIAYFGFFGAVILDECWLETRIIAKCTPAWTEDVFRILYAPLLSDFMSPVSTNSVSK